MSIPDQPPWHTWHIDGFAWPSSVKVDVRDGFTTKPLRIKTLYDPKEGVVGFRRQQPVHPYTRMIKATVSWRPWWFFGRRKESYWLYVESPA